MKLTSMASHYRRLLIGAENDLADLKRVHEETVVVKNKIIATRKQWLRDEIPGSRWEGNFLLDSHGNQLYPIPE